MAITKCKECGAQVSTKADACPSCGAKQVRTSGCAKVVAWGIALVVALIFIGQCSSGSSTHTAAPASNAAAPAGQAATPAAPLPELHPAPETVGQNWEYDQFKDAMSPGLVSSAKAESTNTVSFGFPYQGAQHALLFLRSHPRHGQDVILKIEKGQFLCSSYDGCTVLVRFDDKPPVKWHASGPEDHDTVTLFLGNYNGFVSSMSKAKTVRISAPMYQEGSPVFEFAVGGFDKNRYRPPTK
jgi:hypothetical protein